MSIDTIVPVSGGLDSEVLLYKLLDEGKSVRAVHFKLGRPTSSSELASAKLISLRTNTPMDIVDLTGLQEMQIGYLPKDIVDTRDLDIKAYPEVSTIKGRENFPADQIGRSDGILVSAFHTIISAASLNAQMVGANSISVAIVKEQTVINPSLLSSFQYMEKAISLLSSSAPEFRIDAPLSGMTKAEVVKLGNSLGVPMKASYSCLSQNSIHCGTCSQCVSRKEAFGLAGVDDPTLYEQ